MSRDSARGTDGYTPQGSRDSAFGADGHGPKEHVLGAFGGVMAADEAAEKLGGRGEGSTNSTTTAAVTIAAYAEKVGGRGESSGTAEVTAAMESIGKELDGQGLMDSARCVIKRILNPRSG